MATAAISSSRSDHAVATMQKLIAERIREERSHLKLTQVELAQKAGVSRATLIATEAGQGVSAQNLFAIAAALNLTFVLTAKREQPSRRPRLKELMQAERERQAVRLLALSETSAPSAVGTRVETSVSNRHRNQTARRPNLKDLMANERSRQAALRSNSNEHQP